MKVRLGPCWKSCPNRREKGIHIKWLFDKVCGPGFHRADGRFDASVRHYHNDRKKPTQRSYD
jgi:hypothetical protein